ncbi:hypothetical protein EYF80_044611 [Liparis tanakae]|uniref:Uncharacterized protein n=1 Tax=Liparis tanakae TaxID=230148 RepID=A0A4Z2FWA5_9TELE|nr:hypothetical protein EYF80_044611 [Liparis tanakae]
MAIFLCSFGERGKGGTPLASRSCNVVMGRPLDTEKQEGRIQVWTASRQEEEEEEEEEERERASKKGGLEEEEEQ